VLKWGGDGYFTLPAPRQKNIKTSTQAIMSTRLPRAPLPAQEESFAAAQPSRQLYRDSGELTPTSQWSSPNEGEEAFECICVCYVEEERDAAKAH
jgi:hypothetical protein